MKKNVVLVTVCCILLVMMGSCQNTTKSYNLVVVQNQQPIKAYTIKMIQKMPSKSFILDGKVESGPTLAVLLEDAGIKEFSEIFVKNDAGEYFQTKNPEKYILDITNRGTVKLASEELSKDQWLKDITEIESKSQP